MLLDVKELRGGYGGGDVVQGVSFRANAGEVVFLAGPNGCGKTTLLRLLLGRLPASGGSIRVDGNPLEALRPRALASLLAYIPQQHTPIFAYTALEVVLMGRASHFSAFESPKAADRDAAFAALERLGARTRKSSLWTSPPPAWTTPTSACCWTRRRRWPGRAAA